MPQALRFLAVLATPVMRARPLVADPAEQPRVGFLHEAGLPYRGGNASALDLLLLSPGGPKASAGLLLVGLVLAALAALLRAERRLAILTAWAVALTGLLASPPSQNGSDWAGPGTLVYGIALLAAATVGAEGARERIAATGFGWRQPVAGAHRDRRRRSPRWSPPSPGWPAAPTDRSSAATPSRCPAFVAEESSTRDQARTLVLDGDTGHVHYALVRGSGARMGDGELVAEAGTNTRLDGIVANLVAGSGADQTSQLGGYAIALRPAEARRPRGHEPDPRLHPGTRPAQPGRRHRAVAGRPGRLAHHRHPAVRRHRYLRGPAGGRRRPGRGAHHPARRIQRPRAADRRRRLPGLEGHPRRRARSPPPPWTAGRRASSCPPSGGRLDLTYATPFTHYLWLVLQGFLALVSVVMALPGRRNEIDDDLPEEPATAVAGFGDQPADGDGRRARRLRAAAEAEGAEAPEAAEFPATGEIPAQRDPAAQAPAEPPPAAPAEVPQQQGYDEWNGYAYPQQPGYGTYQDPQYPGQDTGQYPADPYGTGEYASGEYPVNGGQYPQQQEEYGTGQYPTGEYPATDYGTGEYPVDNSQYPQGDYGTGQYPAYQQNNGEYTDQYGYPQQQPPQPPAYDPAYDPAYGEGGDQQ